MKTPLMIHAAAAVASILFSLASLDWVAGQALYSAGPSPRPACEQAHA